MYPWIPLQQLPEPSQGTVEIWRSFPVYTECDHDLSWKQIFPLLTWNHIQESW